jgi:hypothetical protein
MMKSKLFLILLALAACGVKHTSVEYGLTTKSDLIAAKVISTIMSNSLVNKLQLTEADMKLRIVSSRRRIQLRLLKEKFE